MTWTFSAEEWLLDFTSTPRGRARSDEALDPTDRELSGLLTWPTTAPQLVMPSIVPKRGSTRPPLPVDDEAPPLAPTPTPAPALEPSPSDLLEIELTASESDAGAAAGAIFIPTLTRAAPPPPKPSVEIGIPTDDDDLPLPPPPPSRSIADDLFDDEYGSDESVEAAPVEAAPEVPESAAEAVEAEVEVDVETDVEAPVSEPITEPSLEVEVEVATASMLVEVDEAPSDARDEPSESYEETDVEVEDAVEDEVLDDAEAEDRVTAPPPSPPTPPSPPPRSEGAPPPPPRAAEREPAPPPPPRPAPERIERPERTERPELPRPSAESRRRRAWYDDVFGDHYPHILPRDSDTSAEHDVDFMIASARLSPDNAILDVGCGDGRHLFGFAKRGFADLMGLDFSLSQLILAARRNEAQGAGLSFIHGDMRELPTDNTYDVVTCVGGTFGYFDEEQNRVCLQDMVDRLNPGGKLILQVINRDYMISIVPCRSWWQGRGCLVLDVAEMNFFANRLRVHRTIVFEDGRQFEHHMFIRLYTVNEIGKMVSAMGMRVIEVSGSREIPGRFYGASSPDIWICAQRKDE